VLYNLVDCEAVSTTKHTSVAYMSYDINVECVIHFACSFDLHVCPLSPVHADANLLFSRSAVKHSLYKRLNVFLFILFISLFILQFACDDLSL